jgi:hypothetical protein
MKVYNQQKNLVITIILLFALVMNNTSAVARKSIEPLKQGPRT